MKQIDKIKQMNAEEMANFIVSISARQDQKCCICMYGIDGVICIGNNCKKGIEALLKREVEE